MTATPIVEMTAVDADRFHDEIVPAAQPVVFRGLVAHWPAVAAARQGDDALFAYLSRFDRQEPVGTLIAPPEAGGRFFYNDDLSGFNFQGGRARLSKSFDFLLANREADRPATLAAQSIPADTHLPGFSAENASPLLAPEIEPLLWLGSRVIVAAHQDPYENLACVVAGRRRFTLFPPQAVADLYIGPFEKTPGGPPISLVSFDDPDLEKHPRFAQALAVAQAVELAPGDALYIPYLWWHHVRSLEPVNLLTNYWWASEPAGRGQAMDAFLHAVMALRALPAHQRAAWKSIFDHYVFGDPDAATAHLPEQVHGMLGQLPEDDARKIRDVLGRKLSS
ncbi:cupin-like domain-containing protein [Caulobacter segnis]|uniref:cupin-like domain-containing protein n=1 Tax=Caulobacter segnis TaxID=88688 RepID=UPI001CBC0FE3|nr:cupin-like domain-containing protein [Caulobacter segnis]UAL11126.1 cupin-like domain-containing protein [Caulobacter segnis]